MSKEGEKPNESEEEEGEKGVLKIEEAARWCHCQKHDIDYLCYKGCPKCQSEK